MRAVVLHGKQSLSVETIEVGRLPANEVRIQVKACGICGTDQHIYHGHPGSTAAKFPIVLGHELSGVVVEVGEDVKRLKVGDRVSVDPNMYCGLCRFCRNGQKHLCESLQAIGVTRNGGMGELCDAPEANCYVMPEEMSFVEGALVEPLGCVLHGLRKLNVAARHRVLIIGGGFIGQLFLQAIRSRVANELVVCESVEAKHGRLRELGATDVILPPKDDAGRAGAFDIVIECVGRKETMELAFAMADRGAQVLLFGVASPETTIAVSPFAIFSKELRVMGSFVNPDTHEEAIALMRRLNVEPLVSHKFSIDDVPEAMGKYPSLGVSKGMILY